MYTTHALPWLVLPCLELREAYRLALLNTTLKKPAAPWCPDLTEPELSAEVLDPFE